MTYALAATGGAPKSALNFAFNNRTRLSPRGRALVALALIAAKDNRARIAVENLDDVVKAAASRAEPRSATPTTRGAPRLHRGDRAIRSWRWSGGISSRPTSSPSPTSSCCGATAAGGAHARHRVRDLRAVGPRAARRGDRALGWIRGDRKRPRGEAAQVHAGRARPHGADRARRHGVQAGQEHRRGPQGRRGADRLLRGDFDVFNQNDFIKGVGGDVVVTRKYTLSASPAPSLRLRRRSTACRSSRACACASTSRSRRTRRSSS